MSRMLDEVKDWWKAEATRHFLWLPVVFGIGIAIYYHLPSEPAPEVLPALSLGLLGLLLALRKRALPVMFTLLVISLGATWTQVRTADHASVVLREGLSPREIIGTVRDIERTEHGVRLLLNKVSVDDLAPELTPTQIRLSVRLKKGAEFELPHVGDAIEMRAGLLPPMGPALPNGFDFARYFSFRDIGAVGYGLPPWHVLAPDTSHSLMNRFWTWRTRMTDDIVKQLGPGTGGVAAGLITGDARAISDADFNSLRASNLYHIIAISGEHMVVIAGVIFVTLRLLLLMLPARISLRPEGKPIIAIITLVLVSVYLFVTGLPMSAVRAYFMIALVLLAVILRRQVDPMRSLAITAFIMLVNDPASLLDPGFQLSFAATLALIALIESRLLKNQPMIERGRIRRGLYHLGSLLLVSVVAECATSPLVISMFNNVSPYGVFANSLATPLVSFFLMPLVALFFILLPLGFKHFALVLMSYGIDALMGLGRWVASFPHSQLFAPSLPGWGLALFTLGLAWTCLWQTRVRRYGLIACVLGVASLLTIDPPDMLVGSNLKQIAFRTDDGYVLARGRATSMLPELWANGLGYKVMEKADEPAWRCDGLGCLAKVKSASVAFPGDMASLGEDCQQAQVIIASAQVACNTGTMVIDPKRIAGSSVTALWFEPNGKVRVETSAQWQGQRPWSIGPANIDEEN